MIGPEKQNKVIGEVQVNAVVSRDPSRRWVNNAWRVKITETADPSVCAHLAKIL